MNTLLAFNSSEITPMRLNQKMMERGFTEDMFHQACGFGVDSLLIKAMKAQSLDNLSVVMIGLKGFQHSLEKAFKNRYRPSSQQPLTPSNFSSNPSSLQNQKSDKKQKDQLQSGGQIASGNRPQLFSQENKLKDKSRQTDNYGMSDALLPDIYNKL